MAATGASGSAGSPNADAPPQLNVVAQYVRDLSFENPNAPRSLHRQQQPPISIQINVNAKPMGGNDDEVELKVEGRAEIAGSLLFGFDLAYAGMFRVPNVPQENMEALVMIECPRSLFPFAREMIATAARNAGFPPLLIDPVDFVGLYRQKAAQMQAAPPQA